MPGDVRSGGIAGGATGSRLLSRLLGSEGLPILLAILVLFVFFGLYEPRFFRYANLINVTRNSSFLIIISAGQMLVLVVGGFDLSVGATLALASITSALTMGGMAGIAPDREWVTIGVGILAGLAAGALVGLINGICVSLLKVLPFIVTLGTMSVAQGITLYTTNGIPVYGLPDSFIHVLGRMRLGGLPVSVYLMMVILTVVWWVLNQTRFGRHVYATGGNAHAARVSGVRVNRVTIVTYTACGLLAALTGILLTARVGTGEGSMGGEFIMQSIAAAVIGGVSLRGGIGRVEFVVLGGVFLSLITNGMNLMSIDSKLQNIVVGVILIAAIAIDQARKGDRAGG